MDYKDNMNDAERERWRGSISSKVEDHESSIKTLFRLHEITDRAIQTLAIEVKGIATRIGIYATIGAFLGGALISYLMKK